jgi:hypothetical protein
MRRFKDSLLLVLVLGLVLAGAGVPEASARALAHLYFPGASAPSQTAAKQVFSFTAARSGTVHSASVYVNRGSRARRLSVAIYTHRGGSRLTKSATTTVRASVWTRISLPSTRVVQGQTYRLVVMGTAGELKVSSSSQARSCKRQASAKLAVSTNASGRKADLAVNCALPAYIAGTRREFKRVAAPSLVSAPVVSGTVKVGSRLSVSRGQWSGSPSSYSYSWKDCDSEGADCSKISGATSSTYTLKSRDLGATAVAVVAATNRGGTTNASSKPTAVVTLTGTTTGGSGGSGSTTPTQPSTTTTATTPTKTTTTTPTTTTSTTPTTTTSTTPTTTTSTTPTTTTSTTPTTTTTTSGVTFTPIDGGSDYFANLDPASSWLDTAIPIGGWMEQPQSASEVAEDAAMGENIYWNLAGTPGKDVADYNVIRAGGMHIAAPSEDSNTGSETVALQGGDENDLNYGPGSSGWNSGTGACSSSACGYTASNWYYSGSTTNVTGGTKLPYTLGNRVVNQGFGKGVLFFETNAQAALFLNYSDILSADSYWLTDSSLANSPSIGCDISPATSQSTAACGNWGGPGFTTAQSELPANYGWNVERLNYLQSLNGSSKPVTVDVETGCPFTGSSAGNCATPPETIAAAWHALIAGARGIVWFQHNFSGPCEDDRTLLDGSNPSTSGYNCQQTPGVTLHGLVTDLTGFDDEVQALTGALLSPTANGYVSTSADVSTMAKAYGGKCYVFAGSGTPFDPPATGMSATFKLADGYTGPVTVYGESRTVQATGGSFTDTFADANAVHVYEVPSSGC